MDTLQNLRAFLEVARCGGFSSAARKLGLATSVVAKRVDQLEDTTGVRLFRRTTRGITLTEAGQNWTDRVRSVLGDVDQLLESASKDSRELEGSLRIKAPTTLTVMHLGQVLAEFQQRHLKVALEIVLADRPVNPVEEGFDIAISVFPSTFRDVTDLPLCPIRRILCAAPDYLERRGLPRHPRDLARHDTLSFQPTGRVWTFEGVQGPVLFEISPKLSTNDGQVLLAGACAGNGIALISEYVALPALRRGDVVTLLEDFPVPEVWLKALVPDSKLDSSRTHALIDHLQASFDRPPWR